MLTRSPRFALYRSHPELILNLGSCLAVLAIVAIVSYLLARERDSVELSAIRSSNNIVQLIESDILRNAELYDQSLQGLIWAVGRKELPEVPGVLRQRLLFNEAFVDRKRGDVLWLDKQGNVVGDSTSAIPRQANFADTGVFKAHQHNANLGLLVGPPFKAKLGDQDWCISFSRRIPGPDGEFAGLAAGALRLSYFSELFKRLDIGDDSSINLFNTDGQLLARQPTRPQDPLIGTNYAERPNFKRILGERSGSFTALSATHGTSRMYTFARVADLPLIVLVAHSADEVFQSWRRTAILVSVATGVLCIGILWLTLLLGRELRRRHEAEQGLATLAATDSLTGLANRRRLDQVLRQEWARAQRNHKPLAVLMVDVDHFKAFNQRHGHAGGDHALREVAKCIEGCIRRPADLAARYGGEEFQVILPETDLAGATLLAERIRASVAALAPFANDTRAVTVSIGIGLYEANPQHDLASVLGAADEALYRAKANGRNRVEGPGD
ncbi:sensor domain-containing diguanylate cyclase [Pseudomonas kermanshahensis]|uniref:diguanylate cyclase n=1 Tax=Pseudomonas kermanshahensis TaxID=2745482 RepID=A0ABU8R9U3_9PSED|nr:MULTISPECIES: sensor domain-containing diguanylate cyclase [Pseudomonas]MBC3487749.1 GGDEF domain-containing protein [Pseudomonas sp. SWRI50]MBC3497829.1 GGDEF domain-containing protein [Pseudomonas sp. SWRI67]MBV4524909.1 sensor domain-containing diguanylate cyclase [Pseudomonas kermanshahensis]